MSVKHVPQKDHTESKTSFKKRNQSFPHGKKKKCYFNLKKVYGLPVGINITLLLNKNQFNILLNLTYSIYKLGNTVY